MSTSHDSYQPGLPTLQTLRRKTQLTSRAVAEAAGVPLRIEYLLEIGGMVSQQDAEKVLTAFSHLTGTQYSLNTVQVHLAQDAVCLPEQPPRVLHSTQVRPSLGKERVYS